MSAAYLALGAWIGGLISWLVTAAVDYAAQDARVDRKLHELRGAAERDAEYGRTLGILRTAAEDRAGGRASWGTSLASTYAQPLLVALLTGLGSFLGMSPTNVAGPMLAWLTLTGVALAIAIVDGRMVNGGWTRIWWVVLGLWLAALAVFSWLALSAAPPSSPRASVPAPSGSSPPDRESDPT